jgi:hypothetical protein
VDLLADLSGTLVDQCANLARRVANGVLLSKRTFSRPANGLKDQFAAQPAELVGPRSEVRLAAHFHQRADSALVGVGDDETGFERELR